MKAKEIEALESYFNSENEYWNGYTFKILCEVLEQGNFGNPEIPLLLFSKAISIFTEHPEHPVKAVQLFTGEMDKSDLTPNQKLFVFEWIYKYLRDFEFDFDHKQIKDLVNSQRERLKAECQPVKPLTRNIGEILKEMMQAEIEKLPETLKELEPAQRLNILCKLIPFVLSKVETIHSEKDEPEYEKKSTMSWNDFMKL